eukprot:GHVQ01033070.1.p1 GENE.GHVQ01033070.1~~GHVQ01033070.1.p1  ORF type:complete len:108 (+),score=9.18 GHVQ01033070.1:220-543(+)
MTDVCVPNNRVQRTFQLLLNGLANFQLESNSLWSWAVVFIICAVTLEFFLDDVLAELEVSELKAKLRKEERKRERVERNGDEVESTCVSCVMCVLYCAQPILNIQCM